MLTISHYHILQKLGAGGMGEVYLAQDTRLDRQVALKILPAEVAADRQRLNRFVQEAKSASALNHPNIITIYEIGNSPVKEGLSAGDETEFIATEFIDGETLRQRLRNAPLKLGEVLDVGIQVASALSAAHAAGIIHRDIKPENIMVRRDGLAKVLDFGLAKLSEPPALAGGLTVDTEGPTRVPIKTETGVVMGTAIYMSPEQARGLPVDARTDIFSLGVLVYEMVAGRLPFEGSNTNEILASILGDKEPPPLARYAREVPTELERIVAKALRKNRDQRYQTTKDLLLDLQSLKSDLEFERKLESKSEYTGEQALAATGMEPPARQTGRERGVTSAIKLNRPSVVIAALLIIGSAAGAYFYFTRGHGGGINSIAVMPFVNDSGNADVEYLSDGMTETLISSLSQLPNVNVKGRSSVFRYKGKETDPQTIGKELNVQAILNGRVAQRGDQLRLTLELVDASTENVIWSQQYKRKEADLVALQSEIALDVSTKLRTKLSGADEQKLTKSYTANPEAYQLYLRGRFYWNKRTGESLRKSVEYFNQAIEKDPNYALAYAGMADAYGLIPFFFAGPPQDYFPKAKAAAKKALEIDDTLAEAHTSLALVLLVYDWNIAEANRELQHAIELNLNYPTAHHWYGENLGAMGRFDEAIAELKRAQALDPLSLIINADLGEVYIWARQYDKAIEQLRKTIEMDQSFYYAHWRLGVAYEMKGSLQQAIAEYQSARELNDDPWVLALLGHAYAISGKKDEALKTLDKLRETSKQRYVSEYAFAAVYAGLGEKDQAFQWLEKGYEDRNDLLIQLNVDPLFDNLRSDPRFADLVRRIGLPVVNLERGGLAKLSVPPALAGGFDVDTEAPTRVPIKTETGVVMGTAIYMSPEQARGLQVDARTDIFSLGVLIYEMVAGRLPFEGSNTNEILASILSDKEPPPLARYAESGRTIRTSKL